MHIDRLELPGTAGWLGLTACPGREPGLLRGDPARLKRDLDAIVASGAVALLTLVETTELEMLGLADLGERTRAAGLGWYHLPIPDFGAPGAGFEAGWEHVGAALYGHLERGSGVIVHCLAGLGRTGTVAARMLIESGLSPAGALARVRAVRPGSVQSPQQLAYIRAAAWR